MSINSLQHKANSSAPAPWKPEPKPLMESTPFEPRGQPAPKPLMQSYPSNGPPPPSSSQAPWRPGPNQPPGDSYNSPRPGGQHGAAPLWSQPGISTATYFVFALFSGYFCTFSENS